MSSRLTERWKPLRPHALQQEVWECSARFIMLACGRRSGKTELAKRKGVKKAMSYTRPSGNFLFTAPTNEQARRLYWEDLNKLVPRWAMAGKPNETRQEIRLKTGTRLRIAGLDQPQRIEGEPIDWIVVDEYAETKETAWSINLRPALDTDGRPGQAWLIGVPRGRNHYYKLFKKALEPGRTDWAAFTWASDTVLPPQTVQAARDDLDSLTFRQEYQADWVYFEGRIYYEFQEETHAAERLRYDPDCPVVVALDFNVDPGTLGIWQDQFYKGDNPAVCTNQRVSMKIGEVVIDADSNTRLACREFVKSPVGVAHRGNIVIVCGDATGGARKTSGVDGTDWDLVRQELSPYYELNWRVPKANPAVRSRLNATNSRFRSDSGLIRCLIDPVACPRSVEDYEGVIGKPDGSGEIDKKKTPKLTHLSDGDGYFFAEIHPVVIETAPSWQEMDY